jgi:sec-independent protein translocase protein TatB
MFGFSLAELILVAIVALIFIKPEDLPEIARWIAKSVIIVKHYFSELKQEFVKLEDDLGIKEIREEVNTAIASQKIALEEKAEEQDESDTIIDLYGDEHRVKIQTWPNKIIIRTLVQVHKQY